MSLRLAYLALARVLSWPALLTGSDATKDVEILAHRHSVGAENPVTASGQRLRSQPTPAAATQDPGQHDRSLWRHSPALRYGNPAAATGPARRPPTRVPHCRM